MSAIHVSETDAERERRRAAEMSIGQVSRHIRWQTWPVRAPDADVDPLAAWRVAEPIHYPSATNSAVARYHEPTATILLARQGGLMTCILLSDRPGWEQQYIRDQVRK